MLLQVRIFSVVFWNSRCEHRIFSQPVTVQSFNKIKEEKLWQTKNNRITEFWRSTQQSWEHWHFFTTSNENKLEIVESWSNFNASRHLPWCFEFILKWLMSLSYLSNTRMPTLSALCITGKNSNEFFCSRSIVTAALFSWKSNELLETFKCTLRSWIIVFIEFTETGEFIDGGFRKRKGNCLQLRFTSVNSIVEMRDWHP